MSDNNTLAESVASAAELALKLSPLPSWATTLALPVVRKLITDFPQLKADVLVLFSKEEVTEADWVALHARIEAASYEKLVKHSAFNPPEGATVQLGASSGGE